MSKIYMLDLQLRLKENENISTFLYAYKNGLKYRFSQELHHHTIILGIKDYEHSADIVNAIDEGQEKLISSIHEYTYNDVHYLRYKAYFENSKAMEFIFVKDDQIITLLDKYKNLEIIKDKDKKVKEYLIDEPEKSFWPILDEFEFHWQTRGFFQLILDSVFYHRDGDAVKSNLVFNEITDEILDMLNVYISIKYNNKVLVDARGENLKTYLDNDYYDQFVYICELDRINDYWTGIFKSASLYRRIGLEIAKIKGYEYPKEEDVRIMSYLRNLYNGE